MKEKYHVLGGLAALLRTPAADAQLAKLLTNSDWLRETKISDNSLKNGCQCLLCIKELLGYSSTGMGRGRKEGKRRAGSIHHLAWPCYLHPLTKALGRALQQAQLSMDELTLAELPLLNAFHIHDRRDHHPH